MVHNNRVYLVLADSKRKVKTNKKAAQQYQELFERYIVTGGVSLPIWVRFLGSDQDFDVSFVLNNIVGFISDPILDEDMEEGNETHNRKLLTDKTFVIITYRMQDYEKILRAIRRAWTDGQLFHLFFIKGSMVQYYTEFEWRLAVENDTDEPGADDMLGINTN